MSENDRDTHFKQVATLLFAELRQEEMKSRPFNSLSDFDAYQLRAERIIAQRAYDLIYHDHQHIEHIDLDRLTLEEQVAKIPDLAEWPEH